MKGRGGVLVSRAATHLGGGSNGGRGDGGEGGGGGGGGGLRAAGQQGEKIGANAQGGL